MTIFFYFARKGGVYWLNQVLGYLIHCWTIMEFTRLVRILNFGNVTTWDCLF